MTAIELRGVGRSWGPFSLSVSLALDEGEYLVILGPSGCGKSLLLGTVAGIYAPTRGSVLLQGRDVTATPPERRGIGFVFQKSSLFPHLSVTANIEFGLRARGVPRAERRERVQALIRTVGIEALVERPVPALSGGEAQKVAIARALATRPALMLLDEPLSLVDHNARLELQDELRRIHQQTGVTALHVTHNREEARALGSRCAVMLGGRLVQVGPTEELFEHPRCAFVARFLGTSGEAPEAPGCEQSCLAGTGRCDAPYSEGPADV